MAARIKFLRAVHDPRISGDKRPNRKPRVNQNQSKRTFGMRVPAGNGNKLIVCPQDQQNRLYCREQVDLWKMTGLWDAAMCSTIEVDRLFRGAYCLHHQGDESDDGGSTYH
jgi:hypothetical protein